MVVGGWDGLQTNFKWKKSFPIATPIVIHRDPKKPKAIPK
jgi:hypothetical protein